jgi:hypothetical protein
LLEQIRYIFKAINFFNDGPVNFREKRAIKTLPLAIFIRG